MLRDTAHAWFTASCPTGAPIDDLLGKLQVASERHFNCWFHLGSGTMRSGKPFLAYCFEGEFFAFELDERQARLLGLADNHVEWGIAGRRLTTDPRPQPSASLAPPQLVVASIERISGTIGYEISGNYTLPSCLRMTWDRPDGRTCDMYQHVERPLMPVGAIDFDFKLNVPDAIPPGAFTLGPVFFSLHSVPDGRSVERGHALSDTRAILLELR